MADYVTESRNVIWLSIKKQRSDRRTTLFARAERRVLYATFDYAKTGDFNEKVAMLFECIESI